MVRVLRGFLVKEIVGVFRPFDFGVVYWEGSGFFVEMWIIFLRIVLMVGCSFGL